ncbi:hypothetical protein C8F01DRAFT_101209 [Mycena amicta]|nr:hypothetical protein C8F01DRAFT_101209 [Mycena amicta]
MLPILLTMQSILLLQVFAQTRCRLTQHQLTRYLICRHPPRNPRAELGLRPTSDTGRHPILFSAISEMSACHLPCDCGLFMGP